MPSSASSVSALSLMVMEHALVKVKKISQGLLTNPNKRSSGGVTSRIREMCTSTSPASPSSTSARIRLLTHPHPPVFTSSSSSSSGLSKGSAFQQKSAFSTSNILAFSWKRKFGTQTTQQTITKANAAAAATPSSSSPVKNALLVAHQLAKTRLSALVVSTTCVGYALGSGEVIEYAGMAYAGLGTMLCAASANTLNQVFEVENDARMKRTMRRPLPTGRTTRTAAVAFAAACGAAGFASLYHGGGPTAAWLGVGNIALYAGIYTPLKQVHHSNTWVGAAVGAIPPLMGWAAAQHRRSLRNESESDGGKNDARAVAPSSSLLNLEKLEPASLALATVLFFWQMPHFLALAHTCRDDYMAGGYRMLSHTALDPTGRRTALACLRNCLYLVPCGALCCWLGVTDAPFAAESAALGLGMASAALGFYRQPSTAAARRLFGASLLHLPLTMTLMVTHRIPQGAEASSRMRSGPAPSTDEEREHVRRRLDEALANAPFPFLPPPGAIVGK